MTTLYLVRHGQVHNPAGVIYGRLPGYGLSDVGREQIGVAAAVLADRRPIDALIASPMQRAQESAAILAEALDLQPSTEERIIETGIGDFQGKGFESLPRPYITETRVHQQIESAAEIRARFLAWADEVERRYPRGRVVAVSHRDPIIVALLHWRGEGLELLPDFELEPGAAFEVDLQAGTTARLC